MHNHQPVGNFEHVFERAMRECYIPFIEILKAHPGIKVCWHTSGPVLEWAMEHNPDFLPRVKALVERGSLEVIGGGFYEPILAILPRRDAIGQIRMMADFASENLGSKPNGIWLTERVWEPELPEILHDAGVKYTATDDTHFRYAGNFVEPLTGHYITERRGKTVTIFPIDMQLRYLIPFKPPEEAIDYLLKVADDHPGDCITYADDGEKFGIWPGTYDWVIKQGWLNKFFEALEKNSDRIETATFSDCLENIEPKGRVYLPTASYEEMMEWALPAEAILKYEKMVKSLEADGRRNDFRPFIRGGFWDNFLVKYPEVNLIHKRMLLVSEKVEAADNQGHPKADEARRELYMAQCNCAYWHGLFGGVYLNYLRDALYERLIKAEAMVDPADKVKMETLDLDRDGVDEVICTDGVANFGFHTTGGALFMLEDRRTAFSLSNTLARRFEAYHHVSEEGSEGAQSADEPKSIHDIKASLPEKPVYDRYMKWNFIDHILCPETDLEAFLKGDYNMPADLGSTRYELKSVDTGDDGESGALVFEASARISEQNDIRLVKTYNLKKASGEIEAAYVISTNGGGSNESAIFAVEFNFTFLAGDAPDRYYIFEGAAPDVDTKMDSVGEFKDVNEFSAVDLWKGIKLGFCFSRPATLWRFPIHTISRSESGFEKNYQSSCVLALFRVTLNPESSEELNITLKIMRPDRG